MQKAISLRRRLILAATVWLAVFISCASYAVPNVIRSYLVHQENRQLSLYLDQISAFVSVNDQQIINISSTLSNPLFQTPYSGLYWSITSGKQHLRSRSLWDAKLKKTDAGQYLGPDNQSLLTAHRTVYLPDHAEALNMMVAVNENTLTATIRQLTDSLWIILGVMALGILLMIWLQISWSLLPLKRLQKKLKEVREGEAENLDGKYPTEIMPVIDDLNALLFHYQELLLRARNHAGNLSHALKTPISILNNEVNKLPQEAQTHFKPALNQLQQHIDYHLGRARMAGSTHILSAKTPLSIRIDAISMAMEKVYLHRDVMMINELDSELFVAIERRDLDEILGNFIENGYKWAESMIRVHQIEHDDKIAIVMEDDGPGIPEDQYKRVLQRGVRLDESTPGTGLGMNIASELTHSYHGELTLSKSKMGGLKITLILPKARQ